MDYDYDPVPLPARANLSKAEALAQCTDYLDLMSTRRTVRHFSDRPVDRQIIETAVRAAGTSPSGANHQPWHFACVGDPETKRAIRQAAEAEERAFYGGKASATWLQDIGPLGTNAENPFWRQPPG